VPSELPFFSSLLGGGRCASEAFRREYSLFLWFIDQVLWFIIHSTKLKPGISEQEILRH